MRFNIMNQMRLEGLITLFTCISIDWYEWWKWWYKISKRREKSQRQPRKSYPNIRVLYTLLHTLFPITLLLYFYTNFTNYYYSTLLFLFPPPFSSLLFPSSSSLLKLELWKQLNDATVRTTLRQSFHFNFKGVRALTRTAEYAWGNVKLAEMEECNDAKKKRRKKIVYAAKCRGTIELLRMVVKDLGWEFSNLRKCHECDYVWFGPPISRNLVSDEDFMDLRKYPKHRSSKIPGMSKAMAKSVFAQALMVLEKFVGNNLSFSHELSYILMTPFVL